MNFKKMSLQKKVLTFYKNKIREQGLNTSWLFFEKVLRVFVSFSLGVWIANYLGPNSFGMLSYAQSFVGLFSAFATLGLDSIVIKRLVNEPDSINSLIGTSYWVKLMGAVMVVAFLYFTISNTDIEKNLKLIMGIIMISTLFGSFNVIDLFFQSKELNKYVVFSSSIALFIVSLLKIFLILTSASLISFAMVISLESVILSLGLIYFYIKNGNSIFKWNFDKGVAISLIKESWPLMFTTVFVVIYKRIDQVMIFNFLGDKQAGYYGYAVKFIEPMVFLASSIGIAFYPKLIEVYNQDIGKFKKLLQKLYCFVIIIFAVIYLIALPLYSFFIFNFSQNYKPSIIVFNIYLISNLFLFIHNISWRYDVITNNRILLSVKLFIGATINIILNFVFIKSYGLVGAAWATVISYFLAHIFLNFLFKETRPNFLLLLTSYKSLKNFKI